MRGPGGVVTVTDIDRLHHTELGERIDHRMLLHPAAAGTSSDGQASTRSSGSRRARTSFRALSGCSDAPRLL